MDALKIILTIIGLLVPVVLTLFGWFLYDLRGKFDKQDKAIDKQDEAIKELRADIKHNEELSTNRRHSFRNEIMVFVAESMRDLKADLIERFKK